MPHTTSQNKLHSNTNPIEFSIIIPTYNVESYIARCLDSCINQTLHDIEILIIDDCGSDDSIQIAQRYADKDSRVKIIHNEKNLGTFQTRIQGIKHAKGSYIAFLDADDYLHLQACETLHRHTTLHNADILHFKAYYPANPHTPLLAKLTHYIRYILPTRFSKAPLYNEQITYNFFLDSKQFPKFTLWDKCYKNNLLQKTLPYLESLKNQKLIMAEDMLHFFVIATLATSYVGINQTFYAYCLNHASIMQNTTASRKKIADMQVITQTLHKLAPLLHSTNIYALQIANQMSKNLAALIILESRFEIQMSSNTQQSHNNKVQTVLNPLMSLVRASLIPAPTIPKYMRYIRSQYLLSCILSLQYWNRCLTYIRIFAYIVSFGKIKL